MASYLQFTSYIYLHLPPASVCGLFLRYVILDEAVVYSSNAVWSCCILYFWAVVSMEEQQILPGDNAARVAWSMPPQYCCPASRGRCSPWLSQLSVGFTAGQSLAKWADALINGHSLNCHLISAGVAEVYKQLCCVEHMAPRSLSVSSRLWRH